MTRPRKQPLDYALDAVSEAAAARDLARGDIATTAQVAEHIDKAGKAIKLAERKRDRAPLDYIGRAPVTTLIEAARIVRTAAWELNNPIDRKEPAS